MSVVVMINPFTTSTSTTSYLIEKWLRKVDGVNIRKIYSIYLRLRNKTLMFSDKNDKIMLTLVNFTHSLLLLSFISFMLLENVSISL